MQAKSWWESKTLWFNIVFLIVSVAVPVLNHFGWADFKPDATWVTIGGVLVTVVNLILRLVFTSAKLTR
jgi:membrane protein YdbS with pleckstrin-like domain